MGDLGFIDNGCFHPIEHIIEQRNGYIEGFNQSYRTEILDAFAFGNLKQVRTLTHSWMCL